MGKPNIAPSWAERVYRYIKYPVFVAGLSGVAVGIGIGLGCLLPRPLLPAASPIVPAYVFVAFLLLKAQWLRRFVDPDAYYDLTLVRNNTPLLITHSYPEPIRIKRNDNGKLVGDASVVTVSILNKPRSGSSYLPAERVLANLTFFNRSGDMLLGNEPPGCVYGRWGDTPQPKWKDVGARQANRAVRIDPGDRRGLNVVFKYIDDECCYPYDDYSYSAPDHRIESRRIEGESFRVQVELIGKYVTQTPWLAVNNPGIGKSLTVREIPEPSWYRERYGNL